MDFNDFGVILYQFWPKILILKPIKFIQSLRKGIEVIFVVLIRCKHFYNFVIWLEDVDVKNNNESKLKI